MAFKVALIQPKAPNDLSLGPTVAGAEHLGLGYLAAFLRSKGVSVEIVNAEAKGLEISSVIEEVRAVAADIVGLSPVSVTIGDCLEIAAALKRETRSFLVLGGHLASACADEILLNEPVIDGVIVGDGELPLWMLCKSLRERLPLASVPSLVFRQAEKIVKTTISLENYALDDLPFPARDSFDGQRLGHARILTSRGCPYRCSFCTTPGIYSRRIRYRSASNVVDEMEFLARDYGVRHFWFSDDIYVSKAPSSRTHARAIAEEILRRKLQLTYRILCRADSFEGDDDLLKLLKASGLITVFLGLESGSNRILTELRKDLTAEQNRKAVQQLHRAGIALQIGFIMFSPYSSFDDLKQNAAFLRDVGEFYRFFPASRSMDVFPGTAEEIKLRTLGLLNDSFDYRSSVSFDYTFQNPRVGELATFVKDIYETEANGLDHTAYSLLTHSLPQIHRRLSLHMLSEVKKLRELCNEINYSFFSQLVALAEEGKLTSSLVHRLNRERMNRQRTQVMLLTRLIEGLTARSATADASLEPLLSYRPLGPAELSGSHSGGEG